MQLKKKKKKAKKVDISTLDAEIEKLAATEESVVNTDSASTVSIFRSCRCYCYVCTLYSVNL